MSDPTLILTPDNGDLILEDGDLLVGNGLESAAVLSLFGGDIDDSGSQADEAKQFWGNVIQTDPNKRLRSRTQFLLRSLPVTSGNLRRIQDAVETDLAWMKQEALVQSIEVEVELAGVKRVRIVIDLLVSNERYPLEFTREWGE